MNALAPFKCAGCGKEAEGSLKPCECQTGVGYRWDAGGKLEQTYFSTPRKRILVDPKCFALADHFMSDFPASTPKDATELSEDIQAAIEDFIADKFGPEAGAATPEAPGANVQGGIPVGANASHSGVTGGESAATNPPSDGDAISEVKGIARPENAVGVEPPPSGPHSLPDTPQAADTAGVHPLPAPAGQFESDGPKSRPGDAAASHTQQSKQLATGKTSAQERSSDRSGGQFGDVPKPATHSIVMTHRDIRS